MKKAFVCMMIGSFVFLTAAAQATPMGDALKSAGEVAGDVAQQAAVEAVVQQVTPEAQTALDEAAKLEAGAPQENFLVTKAQEFLAAGNYQPALDLANYVITTLNSGSIDAQKIMADAQAALAKIAQEKLGQAAPAVPAVVQEGEAAAAAAQQVQEGVTEAANTIENMVGETK